MLISFSLLKYKQGEKGTCRYCSDHIPPELAALASVTPKGCEAGPAASQARISWGVGAVCGLHEATGTWRYSCPLSMVSVGAGADGGRSRLPPACSGAGFLTFWQRLAWSGKLHASLSFFTVPRFSPEFSWSFSPTNFDRVTGQRYNFSQNMASTERRLGSIHQGSWYEAVLMEPSGKVSVLA